MKIVYTKEQKQKAIKTFKKLKSYEKTLRVLGYPSRHVLYDWVNKKDHKNPNSNPHRTPKHYTWQQKYEAITLVTSGHNIHEVAESNNITSANHIYKWLRLYRLYGVRGIMTKNEKIEAGLYKTKAQLKKELPNDVDELKELAAKLIAEKAVLQEELELSKKLKGGIPEKLSPKLKSKIAFNLRNKIPLELLFETLELNPSSYYYSLKASLRPDKYAHIRPIIHEISNKSMHTYGSPRIWLSLRKEGVFISEKVVRRLMREEEIEVRYAKRKRKYTSYIGEITPAVPDFVQRNFHADKPNKLWLTDITEFAAADSKIYLSPLIDCFDGKVVAFSTSKKPDNNLVEEMIDKALLSLGEKPKGLTIHTDGGGHYRGSMWIEKMEGQGIRRSMSRRGNSGDNAACEGFFGRMKTEMFYYKKWETAEELNQEIVRYINFYNNERIKTALGGVTIKEYRDKLAKISNK